ncbi:MAG: GDP-mannose 4,6-dehydratase [Cyclobacteriaceae bacterium]
MLTYAGDLNNLKDVESDERYEFVKGDICDRDLVQSLFEKFSLDGVIYLATESHVDNSISGPEAFIRTNIFGPSHLIDVARNHWMIGPFELKMEGRFLHVSTDEVYGT